MGGQRRGSGPLLDRRQRLEPLGIALKRKQPSGYGDLAFPYVVAVSETSLTPSMPASTEPTCYSGASRSHTAVITARAGHALVTAYGGALARVPRNRRLMPPNDLDRRY